MSRTMSHSAALAVAAIHSFAFTTKPFNIVRVYGKALRTNQAIAQHRILFQSMLEEQLS